MCQAIKEYNTSLVQPHLASWKTECWLLQVDCTQLWLTARLPTLCFAQLSSNCTQLNWIELNWSWIVLSHREFAVLLMLHLLELLIQSYQVDTLPKAVKSHDMTNGRSGRLWSGNPDSHHDIVILLTINKASLMRWYHKHGRIHFK